MIRPVGGGTRGVSHMPDSGGLVHLISKKPLQTTHAQIATLAWADNELENFSNKPVCMHALLQ